MQNVDEIIEEKKMEQREKELLDSTFKIVKKSEHRVLFQSNEDKNLFLEIGWKSMCSYRKLVDKE